LTPRRLVLALVALAIAALVWLPAGRRLVRDATAYATAASPHERYAAGLRLRRADEDEPGRSWLRSAAAALEEPPLLKVPITDSGAFDPEHPAAISWRVAARRGHRLVVDAEFPGPALFVDVFAAATGERLASAPGGDHRLAWAVEEDGELIVRMQPEIGVGGAFSVAQRLEASMQFPVEGLTERAVQSMFGASRDAGRRRHEGVDIFAPRGTPVLAATDGWVGTSVTNGLGGNVVWVWSPSRGLRTYYAHLDRRAVEPGERVLAGHVVGYVGTSGNARGGPPHLHFGVYARGEGSIDPLPFVCGC
jgi:murein DD-endopeptidase MepM/ murein hydrolase activator NlpD